jgi:hypothetical protein
MTCCRTRRSMWSSEYTRRWPLIPVLTFSMDDHARFAIQPTLGLSVREFDIFRLIASGKSHEALPRC